jgi:hypothetical protein
MTRPPDVADPTQADDSLLFDPDVLKRRIREAIRAAIQDCADEVGLSYEAYLERQFGKDRSG